MSDPTVTPRDLAEKSTVQSGDATPETKRKAPEWPDDWDQVLDHAIRTWSGEWSPQRVVWLYLARYGRGMYRGDARRFLSERAHAGFLTLHDGNRRFYTLNTRKDSR
ncbi:hypothetical protein [Streptomyces cylindrosporus]|uniref:Uncharacterized protein n=1 Tax=Streptomyces cylindrosporus TaxID=2927583 RepID=A0ABS9Y432_9ACTN|nr:hypothetical protein [Streptomyces cylindrosporus]MCI3271436.1 hypothetical protein [Streptomyces cylindrosporus]